MLDRARQTIFFKRQGVRINLGGIAKGYVVERAAAMLRARGVEHALLNAGGDTRVIGDRRGQPWIVGIRHPRVADEVVTRLPLVDEAISTSGDYERFFEENGRRYHHIINPATGRPTEGILTVTVIGPDGTLTDGLDTAIFVLGVEKGLELIEAYPEYETIIVDATGKVSYSKGLIGAELAGAAPRLRELSPAFAVDRRDLARVLAGEEPPHPSSPRAASPCGHSSGRTDPSALRRARPPRRA